MGLYWTVLAGAILFAMWALVRVLALLGEGQGANHQDDATCRMPYIVVERAGPGMSAQLTGPGRLPRGRTVPQAVVCTWPPDALAADPADVVWTAGHVRRLATEVLPPARVDRLA